MPQTDIFDSISVPYFADGINIQFGISELTVLGLRRKPMPNPIEGDLRREVGKIGEKRITISEDRFVEGEWKRENFGQTTSNVLQIEQFKDLEDGCEKLIETRTGNVQIEYRTKDNWFSSWDGPAIIHSIDSKVKNEVYALNGWLLSKENWEYWRNHREEWDCVLAGYEGLAKGGILFTPDLEEPYLTGKFMDKDGSISYLRYGKCVDSNLNCLIEAGLKIDRFGEGILGEVKFSKAELEQIGLKIQKFKELGFKVDRLGQAIRMTKGSTFFELNIPQLRCISLENILNTVITLNGCNLSLEDFAKITEVGVFIKGKKRYLDYKCTQVVPDQVITYIDGVLRINHYRGGFIHSLDLPILIYKADGTWEEKYYIWGREYSLEGWRKMGERIRYLEEKGGFGIYHFPSSGDFPTVQVFGRSIGMEELETISLEKLKNPEKKIGGIVLTEEMKKLWVEGINQKKEGKSYFGTDQLCEVWSRNRLFHRDDGPAFSNLTTGNKEYYLNGRSLTEEQFKLLNRVGVWGNHTGRRYLEPEHLHLVQDLIISYIRNNLIYSYNRDGFRHSLDHPRLEILPDGKVENTYFIWGQEYNKENWKTLGDKLRYLEALPGFSYIPQGDLEPDLQIGNRRLTMAKVKSLSLDELLGSGDFYLKSFSCLWSAKKAELRKNPKIGLSETQWDLLRVSPGDTNTFYFFDPAEGLSVQDLELINGNSGNGKQLILFADHLDKRYILDGHFHNTAGPALCIYSAKTRNNSDLNYYLYGFHMPFEQWEKKKDWPEWKIKLSCGDLKDKEGNWTDEMWENLTHSTFYHFGDPHLSFNLDGLKNLNHHKNEPARAQFLDNLKNCLEPGEAQEVLTAGVMELNSQLSTWAQVGYRMAAHQIGDRLCDFLALKFPKLKSLFKKGSGRALVYQAVGWFLMIHPEWRENPKIFKLAAELRTEGLALIGYDLIEIIFSAVSETFFEQINGLEIPEQKELDVPESFFMEKKILVDLVNQVGLSCG